MNNTETSPLGLFNEHVHRYHVQTTLTLKLW